DSIALSRTADHRTAKGIKAKLLTLFNGALEVVIGKALASQREFGRDYGNICIGIDGKYDLNADYAPVLLIVLKNEADYALSNKENNQTIKLAIKAIKGNIPCNNILYQYRWYYKNLILGNGF
ncbi:12853_t:CDS:2, partial [Funneliformis caledonium]